MSLALVSARFRLVKAQSLGWTVRKIVETAPQLLHANQVGEIWGTNSSG